MKDKTSVLNSLHEFSKKMPSKNFGWQITQFKFDLAKTHPSPFAIEFLKKHKEKNIKSFLQSYENIKKCDDRWPECQSMEDWNNLPEEIKTHCFDDHAFSPYHYMRDSGDQNFFDPTIDSLRKIDPDFELFDQTGYTINQLSRSKNIIYENTEYLQDSNIIEFACGDGFLSAVALNAGAKSSTLTEISDYNLKLCKEMEELANHNAKNISAHKSDIANLKETTDFCYGKDVALVISILTILDNQHDVLKAIAEAKPKYIIVSERHDIHDLLLNSTISNVEYDYEKIKHIIDSPIPAVYSIDINAINFNTPLFSSTNPNHFDHIRSNPFLRLNIPNISWYDATLKKFGYSKTKFHRWSSNIISEIDERFTAVYKID